MTKEQTKILCFGEWYDECIDFLEDDFFNAEKALRFFGDKNYYRLELLVAPQPETISQKILGERKYRERMLRLPVRSEMDKHYIEYALEKSRQDEQRLMRKMESRNKSVGDIDKAREYPIENIIDFNRGDFAHCLWHDDRGTPNLHWYRRANIAHCFVCQKSYDSIDAARAVWGISFIEAIKKLT